MSRRVMVTGGAGFIGSQLGHHYWRSGVDVVLLDDLSFGHVDNLIIDGETFGAFIARDVRDDDLQQHFGGCDVVFHFAGIAALPVCQVEPLRAYDVNTSGTANVLEIARRAGVRRVVFSSTSAVYELSGTPPFSPDRVSPPNLVYAMTKYAAEELCRAYAANYGMDIVICRFFNVYGPHQDFKRKSPPFTSYVARELVAGRQPVLHNNTEAKRDYVHVDDVIRLLVLVGDNDRVFSAEAFNVGCGQGYSVPFLYSELQQIAGTSLQPRYSDSEAFWDRYPELFAGRNPLDRGRVREEVYKESVADIRRTTAEFGWTPTVDIRTGLRSVYEYARRHAVKA